MSYLKTGTTSSFKILAVILSLYGLSENVKKLGGDFSTVGCKSRCAHGMALNKQVRIRKISK